MSRMQQWLLLGMLVGALAGGLAGYAAAREAERKAQAGEKVRLTREPMAWLKLLTATVNVIRQVPRLVSS